MSMIRASMNGRPCSPDPPLAAVRPPSYTTPMADYLTRLNPEQRASVETVDGPLLVLAGAGTGKTRVLTTRFAHILLTGRARPHQVLAVTFTNKAAREMRERVADLLGGPVEGLWLGTFHALAARMLRRHAELCGLKSDFTILDADDQLRLLKQIMESRQIDTKRWSPAGLMGVIQRWKDKGLPPDRVGAAEAHDYADGQALALYRAYQARLLQLNAADFGDLLLFCAELLRTRPEVLESYHRLFRYILVDEYQDTNLVQYYWLRLLAQAQKNICCVGDDDQSIYSWRGAEVENILRFEKDFPGAKIVRLERNYRSTAPILAAASALIANNSERLGKTLQSGHKDASGEKLQILATNDQDREAREVTERIARYRLQGHSCDEMAILVRTSAQMRAFEEKLILGRIPYRVVGGARFYERAEIRDAMAYLRLLHQPADDLAFERIINLPRRGVGDGALQSLREAARAQTIPLYRAAQRAVDAGVLKGRAREGVAQLLQGFDRWRATSVRESHVIGASEMLDESGYMQMWLDDKSPEAPGRVDNLKELLRAMAEFADLGAFLEHVSLVMERDAAEGEARVSLMTLHAAKGLEFDIVFLPGWEEGLFPNQRALDENGNKGLEEERRLAYVGITRARKHAMISYAGSRRLYGTVQDSIPSQFLDELPDEQVERIGLNRVQRPAPWRDDFAWSKPINETRARPAQTAKFRSGQRVFHQKFGMGTVVSVDGDKLDIAFDHSDTKRLVDRFVELV